MDLAAIEEALTSHLDDWQFWAVYADALGQHDAHAERAAAIHRALTGERDAPGPRYDAHQIEVEWRYGHWHVLRLVDERPMGRILSHPLARFLSQLVLEHIHPLGSEIPKTLIRLDIEASGTTHDLTEILPADTAVRELHAPHLVLEEITTTYGLVQLSLYTLRHLPQHPLLPALEALTLHGVVDIASLVAFSPENMPSLHTLRLYTTLDAESLLSLLSSPLGRRLRRLEVGVEEIAAIVKASHAWEHLEALVIYTSGAPSVCPPRCQLRVPVPDDDEQTVLQLANDTTGIPLLRAIDEVSNTLGLRIETIGDPSGAVMGVLLPSHIAVAMARTMAMSTFTPVRLVSPHGAIEFLPSGLEQPTTEGRTPWSTASSVQSSGVISYDSDRVEIEDGLYVLSREGEDHDIDDPYYSGEEDLDESEPEFLGLEACVWAPIDYNPDPYIPYTHNPQQLVVPRELARGSERLPLSYALGRYLQWRSSAARGIEAMDPPDLSRWKTRLLRRHRLEAEPEDQRHPYWREWAEMTREERSRRANPGMLPSFKLMEAGCWLLCEAEGPMLATWLRAPIAHHNTPPDLEQGLSAVIDVLCKGGEIEMLVR